VELSRHVTEPDSDEVASCSASRSMERLRNIAQKMRYPLQSVGARQVCTVDQAASLYVRNATSQYARLVLDCGDYATALRAVPIVV